MIKKLFYILFALLAVSFAGNLQAQLEGNTKREIRKRAEAVPARVKTDVDALSTYLSSGLDDQEEKAYAFYFYTANAIEYNFKKSDKITINVSREAILEDALTEGVGICQHYSELLHALSKSAGLKSYVVPGYTRQNGRVESTAHSWNALFINGKWKLFDPTWGGGYSQGMEYHHRFTEKYFMVSPHRMIKSHMPYDPLFQFSNKVITHKDFINGDFEKHLPMFDNYKKALQRHYELPEQTRLKEAMRRIERVGTEFETVEKYYNFLNQNYRVHYANQQVDLHNQATDVLNDGVDIFNRYVNKLNNNRSNYPGGQREAIKTLEKAGHKVKKALAILKSINPPVKLENAVSKNQQIASRLLKRIDREKKKIQQ